MKKVGRNDPCPCGSGKKYKKCHGVSNVVEITAEPYHAELKLLYERLLEFAMVDCHNELQAMMEWYPEFFVMEDEALMDIYLTGLTAWGLLHEPVSGDDTVFDLFYKKEKNKIKHQRVRSTFESWRDALPSIYEVRSVSGEKMQLQDVRTKKEYQVSAHGEEDEVEEGDIMIGILVPYVLQYKFFIAACKWPAPNEEMLDMIQDVTDEELKEHFPEILGEMLQTVPIPQELEWDLAMYKEVADILVEHMYEKDAHESMIVAAVLIWRVFTEAADPIVRKPEAYAAAVEYIVQEAVIKGGMQTQKELAEEYGISSNTISKHNRTITEVLGEEIEDIFSGVDEMAKNPSDEIPINPSFMMEETMRDIQRAVEGKTFESEEELEQFLADFNKNQDLMISPSTSPRDIAQDKLFEAYEAKGNRRKKLIKEALDIYPDSPDAYLLLAEDAKTMQEAYELYQQAVLAGEKDLGKEFFEENKGHFWLMIETRPYMRAKAELASIQHVLGDTSSAIETYEEMLELNPGDNQGARYVLLTLYLETEQYEAAQELLETYDDERSAEFYFNDVLLHFFRDGFTSKTKSLLKKADEQNPNVKDYLTGKKAVPKEMPAYIGIGDENEAIAYVQGNGHLWEKAGSLLAELEKL